ncbi:MAG: hypothetical protein JW944_15145 [Deltaproteobacteria bacterium]|nr:hypothetical protein [Deltaproteobacteria bacterium]
MSRLLSILSAIIFVTAPAYCLGEEGIEVYSNTEYQFRFTYPAGWTIEQTDYEETVIEIKSPDRKLTFNVGAVRDIALKKVKPEDFIKRFSKDRVTEMYEKEFVDFKLLEARQTTLCSQPAYYWICTFTSFDSEKKQVTMKSMTITANRSEIQYSLTAAGVSGYFDKNRSVLESIIDSFTTGATLWK